VFRLQSKILQNHTVFRKVSNIINALNTLRKRKQKTHKTLRKYKQHLKPGIYLLTDNIASRLDSRLPHSLSGSTSGLTTASLRPLIIQLLQKAIPPVFVFVDHHGKSTATHLLLPDAHGEVKIFDVETQTVSTFFSDKCELERLENAYARLSYLPLPNMHFSENNSSHLSQEEYVDGKPFLAENHKKRLAAWKAIAYCLTTAQTFPVQSLDCHSQIYDYFQKTINSDIPPSLRTRLVKSKNEIAECITTSPNIWAHGDMYGENVLIKDNHPVIIDIMTCRPLPLFYDAMNLLANDIIQSGNSIITSFFKQDAVNPPWKLLEEQTKRSHSYSLGIYLLSFLVLYLGKIRKTDRFGPEKWEPLNAAMEKL